MRAEYIYWANRQLFPHIFPKASASAGRLNLAGAVDFAFCFYGRSITCAQHDISSSEPDGEAIWCCICFSFHCCIWFICACLFDEYFLTVALYVDAMGGIENAAAVEVEVGFGGGACWCSLDARYLTVEVEGHDSFAVRHFRNL